MSALLCLVLSGCSSTPPIGALLSTDGSVSILVRPCPGKGVGSLTVLDEQNNVIYTAVLDKGIGADSVPLVPAPPGYSVTGAFPKPAEAKGRTFLVRLKANDDVNLGAYEFRYDALRAGVVKVAHTKYETPDQFRERKGTSCH